jgi:DNA-directed RNA polymerase subunit A"
MELLDISKLNIDAYIQSTDNVGVVKWHKITNVTRHDPSEYIYTIKTKWGREVSVVASKSLLIWNNELNKFEEKDSEDVKIGDKLPLTFNCPIKETQKFVDLRNYLSPEKYIYGTDYNKGIFKIRKQFEIKDDYVYLRCARRNSIPLKDKFEFNRENGFFIGIYLAEGNTCKDYVAIANNDPKIRQIVKEWFDKNNIKNKVQTKKFDPKRPGLSTGIRGYSTLLVQFIEGFLGKYSHGKYIPDEVFTASDDFIKGLIDGYFSGDGCVTNYHVVVSSVSEKLIHGVSQLLARFGIFTKLSKVQQKKNNVGSKNILPSYKLHVQSKYVYKFGELFTLSLDEKQEKLNKLISRKSLSCMSFLYEEQNDVILDKIISIQKVKSDSNQLYKKVYDITVPETLNFQIFNGLQIRDTLILGLKSNRSVIKRIFTLQNRLVVLIKYHSC